MTTRRRAATSPGAGFIIGIAVCQLTSFGVLHYAFGVLLVPMEAELGWSRTTIVGGSTVAVLIAGALAPRVGRLLDRRPSRPLLVAGSTLAAVLTVAWSQARTPLVFYAVWALMGVAMSIVFYESAFTVIAKRFAPNHRRAMTAVTLIAGLSGFVFQPLTSTLVAEFGWRTALLVLAAILALVTIPVYLVVLAAPEASVAHAVEGDAVDGPDGRFWRLVVAITLATVTSSAVAVLLVAHLVDHDWTLARAAFAGGVLSASQLPGRLAFTVARDRLAPPTIAAAVLGAPAVGVVVLAIADGGGFVWPAAVVLGLGQGATTLLRATVFVDLYGTTRIGLLHGLAGRPSTVARALAPLAGAAAFAAIGSRATFVLLAITSVGGAVVGGRALRAVPERALSLSAP